MDLICEDCGEANPLDAEFCQHCKAFLAWDRTTLTRKITDDTSAARQDATPPVVPTRSPGSTPSEPELWSVPSHPIPAAPDPPPPAEPLAPPPDQDHDLRRGPQPTTTACPQCGQGNPRTVRYCTRCGYSFASAEVPDWSGASSPRSAAAMNRAARGEYRRSLPPFYRWRRVGIGAIAAVAVAAGGVALSTHNPGGMARDAWYWLTKQYVEVSIVAAAVDPPGAAAPGSDPASLVDGSLQEFTMGWTPEGVSSCGPAPGTGRIILTTEPTRIRQVVLHPGLGADNPARARQPRPKTVGVRFGDGTCTSFALADTPGPVTLDVDSGMPVTRVEIGVAEAHDAPADAPRLISLTEIGLRSFPS